MAFHTYQCEQYTKYLISHQEQLKKIYELLDQWPYSFRSMAALVNMSPNTFLNQYREKRLSVETLIALLQAIK